MAATDTKKWERKNSSCFMFAFFPVLNAVPYFFMNSKIKNKKWNITAWILILLQMSLIFLVAIIPLIDLPYNPQYSSVEPIPDIHDYMNQEQRIEYQKDIKYIDSDEWKSSDEYYEFLKASDEWNKKSIEWKKQPEIVAECERNDTIEGIWSGVALGAGFAIALIWLIVLINAFLERPRFLRMLRQEENRDRVFDIMETTPVHNTVPKNKKVTENKNVQPEVQTQININSADEEELAELKGLTIIDAKKAVEFRESHGGFKSVDEFFSCINAKPHIMVSLESRLTVGEEKKSQEKKPQEQDKRIIDI